jgi:hypothetical protein
MYTEEGAIATHARPFVICDGGYHRWRGTISGFSACIAEWLSKWTALVGSVRKDVECAFGVLKRRFRILKLPFEFADAAKIQNVFRTCVVLHNMIHMHRQREGYMHAARRSVDYDCDGRHCNATQVGRVIRRVVTVSSSGEVRALDWRIDEDSDVSYVEPPGGGPAWGTATVEAEPEFFSLRECLVAHYKYTKTNHPALLRPTEVAKHANKQDYHDNED